MRALEFNANLTGVHLGSPRARHWGLWLYMHKAQFDKAKE